MQIRIVLFSVIVGEEGLAPPVAKFHSHSGQAAPPVHMVVAPLFQHKVT